MHQPTVLAPPRERTAGRVEVFARLETPLKAGSIIENWGNETVDASNQAVLRPDTWFSQKQNPETLGNNFHQRYHSRFLHWQNIISTELIASVENRAVGLNAQAALNLK